MSTVADRARPGERALQRCEYFVTCQRVAEGAVLHPVAGLTAACASCAGLAMLELLSPPPAEGA